MKNQGNSTRGIRNHRQNLVLLSLLLLGLATVVIGSEDEFHAMDDPARRIETKDSRNNVSRILFTGETQRIDLPRYARDIRITAVDGSTATRAAVSLSRKCPPLTGGKLRVHESLIRDYDPLGYEWFPYNLNPGSSVDVGLVQHGGSTNFYLLKGAKALEEIETGSNTDPRHWDKIAVAKAKVTSGQAKHISYQRSSWDKDQDNIYTMVYDNPSKRYMSEVDITTSFVLTTHALKPNDIKCDHMDPRYHDYCTLSVSRNDCIIVEAFTADGSSGFKTVTLDVEIFTDLEEEESVVTSS